ncbi:hypothetical protein NPIL_491301 [Nephila pilipes]|uniref:Uncharacterized protein n=1 Tax=Nephila pilipes TaxID=299642 RepID=A0A8X6QVR8_NEPPI|nr:hypothetical protein NPIL_491301 [Nephila pilipes]
MLNKKIPNDHEIITNMFSCDRGNDVDIFFLVIEGKNKTLSMKVPDDLEIIRSRFFYDSDNDVDLGSDEGVSGVVRDADGAELVALLSLLYLAGVCHGNRVNCGELWRLY